MVDAEYKLEGAWLCGFGAIACERRAFARPGEETEAPGAGPGRPGESARAGPVEQPVKFKLVGFGISICIAASPEARGRAEETVTSPFFKPE